MLPCLTCMSVLQGEQEYEMSVKLYDEVDSEQSRWEILSTKVRSPHIDSAPAGCGMHTNRAFALLC